MNKISLAMLMSLVLLTGCDKTPTSNPQVEFKQPIMQCKNDGINERCYDKELHVYCWRPYRDPRYVGEVFSCVPGQWTFDEKDVPYEG